MCLQIHKKRDRIAQKTKKKSHKSKQLALRNPLIKAMVTFICHQFNVSLEGVDWNLLNFLILQFAFRGMLKDNKTQTKICGMSTKFLIFSSFHYFIKTDTISSTTQPTPPSATRKKPSSRKPSRSNGQSNGGSSSYEHHLEKWLENTSKMNFDCNNLDGNWPFMNAPNAFQQQQPTNRKGNSHLQQYGWNDPISLPSHTVSLFHVCDFKISFENSCNALFR